MEIKKITVIGGGLMGRQIALNSSIYGIDATVYDLKPEVCDSVEEWVETYLQGRIKKGHMDEQRVAEVKQLFHVERDLAKAVSGSQLIIEAVVEIEAVKRSCFKQLDELIGEDVIIATNSGTMVSSIFTDCVKNPSRLANMHFFNPALVMKLVEITQGPHTSEETAQSLYDYCVKTGKTPIVLKKELSGFIVNYMLLEMYKSARWLVSEGYCSYQDLDKALKNGLRHPMGLFELDDFTGVDLSFNVMQAEYEKTGKKPYMYDIYKKMVEEGRIGRKSGHGFYDYE